LRKERTLNSLPRTVAGRKNNHATIHNGIPFRKKNILGDTETKGSERVIVNDKNSKKSLFLSAFVQISCKKKYFQKKYYFCPTNDNRSVIENISPFIYKKTFYDY
jgi:hypothetical protein